MPSGRSSLVSQVYKNSLFVFGGYNGQVVLNDFYEYRFEPVLIPSPTLLDDLRGLVNNQELSDVTFLVEGRPVHASKILVASRSEHFRAMLYGGMRESFSVASKGPEDVGGIVIEDVGYEVFLKMMEYLYTDHVEDIPSDSAVALLIAAERYLLARLKSLCEDAIRKGINTANVVGTFLAAHRHHAWSLKDMCLDFILEHLEQVKATPTFGDLKAEPDLLMEIIMHGA